MVMIRQMSYKNMVQQEDFKKMQERIGKKQRVIWENYVTTYSSKCTARAGLMQMNSFVGVYHRYSR